MIAIVDSGVDGSHPDLAQRLIPGYNFYDGNTDTSDGCGHGTHVAGIAASSGDNGTGIAGIAFNAKIMPVKVMSDGVKNRTADLSKASYMQLITEPI